MTEYHDSEWYAERSMDHADLDNSREDVVRHVLRDLWLDQERPFWMFRERGTARKVANVCIDNWVAIADGSMSRRQIRRQVSGSFALIISILIPIIWDLILRWLENRDK